MLGLSIKVTDRLKTREEPEGAKVVALLKTENVLFSLVTTLSVEVYGLIV